MEQIPWDKPVILAINHPSAFLEPCLLACFLPKPLYFLVRGDIWNNNFYNQLMRSLHLVPVYRNKDGYSNLTKNYDTFEFCYESLAQRKPLVVLPEGATIQEKRLRSIKKGLARICFGALEKYPGLDIHIVPVGANFTYADQPRTDVSIDFGRPIRLLEYLDEYYSNPKRAEVLLTKDIEARMKACIIHIEHPDDDDLVEKIFLLSRSEETHIFFDEYLPQKSRLELEKNIASHVNKLSSSSKETLKNQIFQYFDRLIRLNVSDAAVKNSKVNFWMKVLLIIGFPVFLIGYLLHILPLHLTRRTVKKQVEQLEFRAPVFVGIGIFSFLFYYLLWFLLAAVVNLSALWILLISMPISGLFAIYYHEKWSIWRSRRRAAGLAREEKEALMEQRDALIQDIRAVLERVEETQKLI